MKENTTNRVDVEELRRWKKASNPRMQISKLPEGKLRITANRHDLELDVRFLPGGKVELAFGSRSSTRTYISGETKACGNGQKFAILAASRRHRSKTFPFFDLPAELRVRIYEFVLSERDGYGYVTCIHPDQVGTHAPHGVTGFFVPRAGPFDFLSVNHQMRSEFAVPFFRAVDFDLAKQSAFASDLEKVLCFLQGIGEIGRSNIESLSFVWWMESWRTDHSASQKLAADVSKLIKACKRLEFLGISIPKRKGLGSHKLRSCHFGAACGFSHLRSLHDIRGISIDSPNWKLSEWLMEGVTKPKKDAGTGSSKIS